MGVLGMVVLRQLPALRGQSNEAFLSALRVRSEAKRSGVGMKLLLAADEKAKELGVQTVRMAVASSNVATVQLVTSRRLQTYRFAYVEAGGNASERAKIGVSLTVETDADSCWHGFFAGRAGSASLCMCDPGQFRALNLEEVQRRARRRELVSIRLGTQLVGAAIYFTDGRSRMV